MNVFPLTLAVSGLERHLGETGSSIASRVFAGCSTGMEQVGQCSKDRKICRVLERPMIVFYALSPIDFGLVGFGATPRGNRK